MIEIEITADSPKDLITQIHDVTGGVLEKDWNESVLKINNDYAIGFIRFVGFDWGVNLLDFELKLHKEFIFKIKANEEYNPIRFLYPSTGYIKHRFGVQNEEKIIEQFQSLVFTNKTGGYNYISFPENQSVDINIIQITRKHFLKKRTTNVSSLNKKLHEIFIDTDHENRFANFGTLNLKMADLIQKMKKVKGKGMLRILKIEAKVYEILSLHIQQHNRILEGEKIPNALDKGDLKIVRKIGNGIVKSPAKEYSLEQLSYKSGLTQAKLQEGFKFLYNRTVTEYIRHIRLESARNLLKNTDLNVSQVHKKSLHSKNAEIKSINHKYCYF